MKHTLPTLSLVILAVAAVPTTAVAQNQATTPVIAAGTGQTRTLSDVARERKLGKRPTGGGTLSVSGASGMPAVAPGAVDKSATDADARLARAITDGAWVDRNIHYNENIKQDARNEWDAAAENCRKTPGCTPVYRENVQLGGVKPLRTGDEIRKSQKSGQKAGDGTSW